MRKARVFISCGQKDNREKSFGDYLVKYFEKDFEVYFAEEIHNSKPLLLSIFQASRDSEYFVAFNPYRKETGEIGSLFVQQEIAIAAFLDMPLLYFCQKGVNKTIGMSGGLHLNGISIDRPEEMKQHLDKVTNNWDSTSKNQLFLEFNNPHKSIPVVNYPGQPLSNWYHITVINGSVYKHAKNCRAYVESIRDIKQRKTVQIDYQQELIWAGTGTHTIFITKKVKRDVDVIWTIQGSKIWQFQFLQTSTVYAYPNLGEDRYRIVFSVISDNFLDARLEVILELLNDQANVISQKQL